MDIFNLFGLTFFELVIFVLLCFILLSPKDIEKVGRIMGRWLRDLTNSESWRAFRDTSREIRNLPQRMMREANLEDLERDVGKIRQEIEKADLEAKGSGARADPLSKPKSPPSKPSHIEAPEGHSEKILSPAKNSGKKLKKDA